VDLGGREGAGTAQTVDTSHGGLDAIRSPALRGQSPGEAEQTPVSAAFGKAADKASLDQPHEGLALEHVGRKAHKAYSVVVGRGRGWLWGKETEVVEAICKLGESKPAALSEDEELRVIAREVRAGAARETVYLDCPACRDGVGTPSCKHCLKAPADALP